MLNHNTQLVTLEYGDVSPAELNSFKKAASLMETTNLVTIVASGHEGPLLTQISGPPGCKKAHTDSSLLSKRKLLKLTQIPPEDVVSPLTWVSHRTPEWPCCQRLTQNSQAMGLHSAITQSKPSTVTLNTQPLTCFPEDLS